MSDFIHNLRTKHRFSQEEIAKHIGVSRQTFALIEKGETDLTVPQMKKLTELFGYNSLDSFLSEHEQNTDNVVLLTNNTSPIITEEKTTAATPMQNKQTASKDKKLDKMRELLLYILAKIGAKPNIGESVICQLLYFIDFDYYERYSDSLIGCEYIKSHHGPFPANINELVSDMEKNGELVYVDKKYFQFEQKKYLPLRDARLDIFTAKEIEHVNWVIARLSDKNVKEMEEYSKRDVPWISATYLNPIDYKAVFYRAPEYSVKLA